MDIRKTQLAVLLILTGVLYSSALALPPMGPPKATLDKNKFSLDFKYAYQETDLKLDGKVSEKVGLTWVDDYTKYKIKSLRSNTFLGSLGYGICDNWGAFMQFGIADAQDEIVESTVCGGSGNRYYGFSGDYGFAWGFGTRATFCKQDSLTWGGIFQMTWSNPGDSKVKRRGDSDFSGNVELDFWEIQIAVGPTLKLDSFSIYGGPFLHFVRGDWDINGTPPLMKSSADIQEESIFGAYGGVQLDITEQTSWYSECQMTADAWGLGTGVVWKF